MNSSHRYSFVRAILLVVPILINTSILSTSTFAQEVTGRIYGTVKDEAGAALANVKVTIADPTRNVSRTVLSDEEGAYSVPLLPTGNYEVQASSQGFKQFVRPNIRLDINQNQRVDVTLQVGQISEQVLITSETVTVETKSAALGKVVGERQILDLPLNGRNYLQLVSLQPGAIPGNAISANSSIDAPSPPGGVQSLSSVGGQRVSSNSFLLDGVDNNDAGVNSAAAVPAPDALQEFKVITNSYSAEFGRNAGSIINVVTKSGTNAFHGGAYEFFRNDVLDARNFFSQEREPLRQNQFGANIGGPILKNRLTFFGHYEGFRLRQSFGRLVSVPSQLERSGIFSGPVQDPVNGGFFPNNTIPDNRIDPIARKLLQLYPIPDTPTGNTVFALAPTRHDRNQFMVRADYQVSPENSLMGRYFFDDGKFFNGSEIEGFGTIGTNRYQNVLVQDTHVFSPRLVNEFRFAFNHTGTRTDRPVKPFKLADFGFTFPLPANAVEDLPIIAISGFSSLGNSGNLVDRFNNIFTFQDNVTYSLDRHVLKAGFTVRRLEFDYAFNPVTSGVYVFVGAFTFNPFADFLLGQPFIFNQFGGDPFRQWRSNGLDFYVQDEYQLSKRVTLSLGLRYDYDQPIHDLGKRGVTFIPGKQSTFCSFCPTGLVFEGDEGVPSGTVFPDKNNFSPRIGFAWDVFGNSKTSVRGAYGIFHDTSANINTTNLGIGCPFYCQILLLPVLPPGNFADPFGGTSPFTGQKDFIDTVPIGSAISPLDLHLRTPYVQQYHLTVQQALGSGFILEVGYVGNKGTKLWGLTDENFARFVPGGSNAFNILSRRPFGPQFGEIRRTKSVFNSNYNSLQVSAQKRFSGGLAFLAAYTWSKSIDQISTQTAQLMGIRGQATRYPANPNDFADEHALSAFDVPHRFVFSYNWELPFFKSTQGITHTLLSGWQVNGITSFQKGTPFSVFDTSDQNFDGNRDDRPNLVGDPHAGQQTPNQWFNTSALAPLVGIPNGPTQVFGSAGRNILRSGGINNSDVSIFKDFHFEKSRTLQFRIEAFNVFNHPTNFDVPVNDIRSPNFGKILATRTFSQRVIQFGLKFYF